MHSISLQESGNSGHETASPTTRLTSLRFVYLITCMINTMFHLFTTSHSLSHTHTHAQRFPPMSDPSPSALDMSMTVVPLHPSRSSTAKQPSQAHHRRTGSTGTTHQTHSNVLRPQGRLLPSNLGHAFPALVGANIPTESPPLDHHQRPVLQRATTSSRIYKGLSLARSQSALASTSFQEVLSSS